VTAVSLALEHKARAEATVERRPGLRQAGLGRVGFSIADAASALGMSPAALRRLIERHARAEGHEAVARLNGGIVAHKRHGMGRWLVIIPADLRPGT
jgi:hypothetical protein